MLQGKVAWVTGAGSGIGRAGALELAAAGAHLVLSGRRAAELETVAAEIKAAGGSAEAAPVDIIDQPAVARLVAGVTERHGRLDILVNSAGINVPKRLWKDTTPEGWDHVVAVNLNGAYYCAAAVLPTMRRQKDGLIILVASWAGRFISLFAGAAYIAAKHGAVAMAQSLNMEECVNGIRACTINPGEVATPLMQKRPVPPSAEDLARMLQPEDLGRTIRFVAEMPAHVCVNEILISPTWNRSFIGGSDLARR